MPKPYLAVIVLAVTVFVLSTTATWLVRRIALARSVLDQPGERSAHRVPTPTSGGLAIAAAFYCGLGLLILWLPFSSTELICLGLALVLVVLGLLDDLHQLDFRWRMLVHLTTALAAALLLGQLPPLQLGPAMLNVGLLSLPLLVFCLVGATNLYNFMDGTDGLAGSECCFIAAAAALLLLDAGNLPLAALCVLLAAASAGFLVWNWSPARIFMGDAGSGFLGFLLALLALLSFYAQATSLWSWLLLAGVFIADASTTLVKRMLSGQRWYQAHSSHAYQHAARRFGHRKLALAVLAINLGWLLPLAWLAEIRPEYGVFLTFFGIVPLFAISHAMGAGRSASSWNTGQ